MYKSSPWGEVSGRGDVNLGWSESRVKDLAVNLCLFQRGDLQGLATCFHVIGVTWNIFEKFFWNFYLEGYVLGYL